MSAPHFPFRFLRFVVKAKRAVKKTARRVFVGSCFVLWGSWWALTTVATTGLTFVAAAAVFALSVLTGGASWLLSGE
jgi:hypothetical protein